VIFIIWFDATGVDLELYLFWNIILLRFIVNVWWWVYWTRIHFELCISHVGFESSWLLQIRWWHRHALIPWWIITWILSTLTIAEYRLQHLRYLLVVKLQFLLFRIVIKAFVLIDPNFYAIFYFILFEWHLFLWQFFYLQYIWFLLKYVFHIVLGHFSADNSLSIIIGSGRVSLFLPFKKMLISFIMLIIHFKTLFWFWKVNHSIHLILH